MPTASRTSAVLAALDRELREGRVHLASPPTRFYFNLTERCSLRCRHCITRAPERTARRSARDLAPEVLEALRPHLADAAYVGFPHAGEPLVAPLLEPLLQALRDARGGEPTVVHLLTNAVALTPARQERLVGLGVNSISVSLDGMSAATNDALRLGARVEELLPRLRELAERRRRERWDLRVGIAWTLTRDNVHEVDGLLRFAAEAGLDWVKLEELYPVSAEGAALALEPRQSGEAVAGALALADSLGVRLLEHVFDKQAFKCRLGDDAALARFSKLDDFANRMEINSCRLPWELVCVEPDGAVKPVAFERPAAGNVLERDLGELWNSGAFVEARRAAMASRPCGPGPLTCGADPGPERW